jgi:hypothetical protein
MPYPARYLRSQRRKIEVKTETPERIGNLENFPRVLPLHT